MAGKGTADIHALQPLVALAADVWSAAFKTHFLAFWAFAQSHKLRISRLDETQHVAIHSMNAATRLAAQLEDCVALKVQRIALSNASCGILTLSEVAGELGIEGITAARVSGARSPSDAARMIGEAGPANAAKLLSYARVAWLCEEMLVVDLGDRVRNMQMRALRMRLKLDDPNAQPPLHSTHICICTECRRVANACVVGGSGVSFNELGVSACQVCTNPTGDEVQLHCAKRSSAALRGAVASESEMKKRRIEREVIERTAIAQVTTQRSVGGQAESGVAARMRRDAKNALEQRTSPLPCGEHAMATVPVLGKVVRIYKAWYGLCCYCASLVRVQPHYHRYGGDLCCMSCDHTMFNIQISALPIAQAPTLKVCRFCGHGMLRIAQTLYTL